MNRKEDDLALCAGSDPCNYPNCHQCDIEFTLPFCMLDDAGIRTEETIIVEPKEGYVIIKNDEEK